jgi:hypothetical protein
MHHKKTCRFAILSTLVAALSLPILAAADSELEAVPKNATTKHFIQLQPGMQRTAFTSKTGLNKKQFIASLGLPSKKERPH